MRGKHLRRKQNFATAPKDVEITDVKYKHAAACRAGMLMRD